MSSLFYNNFLLCSDTVINQQLEFTSLKGIGKKKMKYLSSEIFATHWQTTSGLYFNLTF